MTSVRFLMLNHLTKGGAIHVKNILLAFDGSPYSAKALTYARNIAEQYQATMWLVHVFAQTSGMLGYENYEKLFPKR